MIVNYLKKNILYTVYSNQKASGGKCKEWSFFNFTWCSEIWHDGKMYKVIFTDW